METTTETAVEREVEIDASPETVWQFLIEADKLDRWFGNQAWLDVPCGRHGRGSGFTFADGHAEIHKWNCDLSKVQYGANNTPVYDTTLAQKPTQADFEWMTNHIAPVQ